MNKLPYFFDAKSISESRRKGKKPCNLLTAAKHNCRELKAELGAYGRIDGTRRHLNEVLLGPVNAAEIVAAAADDVLVPNRNRTTLRRDHTQAIELVFSLPLSNGLDVHRFFMDCVKWVGVALMGHRIYSAIIHHDEGCPHCHVLVSPIRFGVRVGSEAVDRPSLNALKDKFWCEIAAPNGLAMPAPRLSGEQKQKAIQEVLAHAQTERLPCVDSFLWPFIEASVRKEPAMAYHLLNARLGEGRILPQT